MHLNSGYYTNTVSRQNLELPMREKGIRTLILPQTGLQLYIFSTYPELSRIPNMVR